MADTSTTTAAPKSAPAPAPAPPTPAPTTTAQASTAPANQTQTVAGAVVDADNDDTSTYYVRPGIVHTVVERGNLVEKTEGDKVELTEAQAEAFRDKFFTPAEYKTYRAGKDAEAKAALEANQLDPATTEGKTPEETQALENKDTGKANTTGQPGTPA
jgi:hypothetical protein